MDQKVAVVLRVEGWVDVIYLKNANSTSADSWKARDYQKGAVGMWD